MGHPITHAESSAKRYGGVPEDYLPIHDFMDSSKAAFPDNRHRALTHNSWFIFVVERVFGHEIDLTGGGKAKVRYVCEQHILEDFGGKFIPTVADFLGELTPQPWMNNAIGGAPPSQRKMNDAPIPERQRGLAFTLD